MKRFHGFLLALVLIFSVSTALAAQRVECSTGGFSVSLPDKFVEEACFGDPDLCFYWHGDMLTVQAYVSYQGEVAGSDLFQVLTGYETDYGTVSINGMTMLYTRTEEYGSICISYTWMDRGNQVSMEFSYDADDESAVQRARNSIINSISFDAGH